MCLDQVRSGEVRTPRSRSQSASEDGFVAEFVRIDDFVVVVLTGDSQHFALTCI